MAATLTGCVTFGAPTPSVSTSIALPPVPADLQLCFGSLVPRPPAGDLTRQQVFRVVADLKASESGKSKCGKRLIDWYATQATILGGAR